MIHCWTAVIRLPQFVCSLLPHHSTRLRGLKSWRQKAVTNLSKENGQPCNCDILTFMYQSECHGIFSVCGGLWSSCWISVRYSIRQQTTGVPARLRHHVTWRARRRHLQRRQLRLWNRLKVKVGLIKAEVRSTTCDRMTTTRSQLRQQHLTSLWRPIKMTVQVIFCRIMMTMMIYWRMQPQIERLHRKKITIRSLNTA